MILKKLLFAPIFLTFLGLFLYYLQPMLKSTDLLFSMNQSTLMDLIILAGLVVLASTTFAIFIALAQDYKIIIPFIVIACALLYAFFPEPIIYAVMAGFFIGMVLVYLTLKHKLDTYVTFSASSLLTPSAKMLTTFLVLSITIGYYLLINTEIKQKGFQIPDSLIDMALKISTQGIANPNVKGVKIAQLPTITQEQIDLLKQNPELLKQYGIDPAMLETVENSGFVQPSTSTNSGQQKPKSGAIGTTKIDLPLTEPNNDFTKNLVKSMLNTALEPYKLFIAPLLALILLTSIKFFTSVLELLLPGLISLLFVILEKSGFIRFDKEMREVKKLVV